MKQPTQCSKLVGLLLWGILAVILLPKVATATILPEERTDILYHEYDGDGIKISGPSVLVRKNFIDKVSVSANYYIDNVTSASIDVRSFGSPYTEKRNEQSLGFDVLGEKNIMSFSYTNSSENDYEAETYFVGISQDFFGDLTNVSIGFGIGSDEIKATGLPDFKEELDRQNYRLGISQILTKKLILGINIETVTEEGYLQNPYRKSSILEQGDSASREGNWENENYPDTRTSDAISLSLRYYLPYRAAVHSEFRYYSDSWDIQGRNFEIGYSHPLDDYPVTLDVKYRFYKQSDAFFFFDIIDRRDGGDLPKLHGRDKELSNYTSTTWGIGAKWTFLPNGWRFLDKASVSMHYDLIDFVYENFRDATAEGFEVGKEPKFEFDASVIRFYFTGVY